MLKITAASLCSSTSGMSLIGVDHLHHHSTPSGDGLRRVTNAAVRQKRSRLFDNERKRQTDLIPRIEKIEVKYVGVPENTTLVMNRNLSTPFDVAKRKGVGNHF